MIMNFQIFDISVERIAFSKYFSDLFLKIALLRHSSHNTIRYANFTCTINVFSIHRVGQPSPNHHNFRVFSSPLKETA